MFFFLRAYDMLRHDFFFYSFHFNGLFEKKKFIQGHIKPVIAITFSGDGRLIVSCSLEEGMVRVWNPSPGLLGMIAGSLTNGSGGNGNGKSKMDVAKGFKTPLSSTIRPSKTFSFNLGEDGKFVNI